MNPPDDVSDQTRLVMETLQKCLQAAGATFADVVRTDVFVTDMHDQDAIVKSVVDERLKLEVNAIAVTRS